MTDAPLSPFLLAPLLAFLAVLVIIPVACRLALKYGFVDEPGGRKQHEGAVPPVGGLIIFPVYISVAILAGVDLNSYGMLFIALIIVLMTGAIDDRVHLSAWVKFGVQILTAFLIVLAGDARLYHLGDIFSLGNLGLDFMSIPFSVAAVVLLINAINLMDGLDGLAAGKSFVILSWLIVACIIGGNPGALFAMLPLMGVLAGFLFYNMRHPFRPRAKIFLGDAGSMGLGLTIAWFSISLTQGWHPVLAPISVAWILAIPIIDECAQFNRRVREGRHPFDADRGHFHHHFIHAGISVGRAVALILLLGILLGGIGYFGVLLGVPQVILTLAWIALLFGHMYVSLKPEQTIKALERFKV